MTISVNPERIQELLKQVVIEYHNPEGRTVTFAHAYIGAFYVATGMSACVDPTNFNSELGKKYALENLQPKLAEFFWNHEGYRTFMDNL